MRGFSTAEKRDTAVLAQPGRAMTATMTGGTTATMKSATATMKGSSAAHDNRETPPPAAHDNRETPPLDAQQRRAVVIDRMTDYMLRLLRTPLSEHLRWTGTLVDLVESVHVVWQTGRIRTAEGFPMAFRELLARVCRVLHTKEPANPRAKVIQARQRKGIRSCSVVVRYEELLFRAHLVNPFQMDVGYE